MEIKYTRPFRVGACQSLSPTIGDMKILITGINGFLGRHVAQSLCLKHEICGVSRNDKKIDRLKEKVLFLDNSVNDIENDITKFSPDTAIHFAWSGGNSYLDTNSNIQFYDNIPQSVKLMDLLRKIQIKHFIGIGTVAEYENKNKVSLESDPEIPINLYGTCKTMMKLYSERVCKNSGIKWTWCRPYHVYGPEDVSTRLIPKTIEKCIAKQKLTLNSCDSVTDYLYIDDFVSAITKIVESHVEGIYNICSGQQYTIRKIVEFISEKTNNTSNITFDSSLDRIGFPKFICGSNEKLKAATGWTPIVDMNTGLDNIITKFPRIGLEEEFAAP
jgi:UDP-glucose 4-epimerase